MNTSAEWEQDFPKGYGHTSIAYLKRCDGFEDAKLGDISAACFVVKKCVKANKLSAVREKYPNAILLPILSRNALPLALAYAIGLPVWRYLYLSHTQFRKELCAAQRLLHKPIFFGYIERNLEYIIVDDVVTQGGTVSALRKHVITNGGVVVAVVALAYAVGSHDIAPTDESLTRLKAKHGDMTCFLQETGIAATMNELTNSQVRYLLRFSRIESLIRRLAYYTC